MSISCIPDTLPVPLVPLAALTVLLLVALPVLLQVALQVLLPVVLPVLLAVEFLVEPYVTSGYDF